MPQVIYSFEELVEMHGGDPISVGADRWLLPDGVTIAHNGYGPIVYTPPDPAAALLERVRYHEALASRAETHAEQLTAALAGKEDKHGVPLRFKWPAKIYGAAPPGDGHAALAQIKRYSAAHTHKAESLSREFHNYLDTIE